MAQSLQRTPAGIATWSRTRGSLGPFRGSKKPFITASVPTVDNSNASSSSISTGKPPIDPICVSSKSAATDILDTEKEMINVTSHDTDNETPNTPLPFITRQGQNLDQRPPKAIENKTLSAENPSNCQLRNKRGSVSSPVIKIPNLLNPNFPDDPSPLTSDESSDELLRHEELLNEYTKDLLEVYRRNDLIGHFLCEELISYFRP